MNFFLKFPLQLLLLVHIQVSLFDGIQNAVGNFWVVEVGNFVSSVLIIKRNRRAVLNSPLEIIYGYVSAKGALGGIIARKQWRSSKSNAGCSGQ